MGDRIEFARRHRVASSSRATGAILLLFFALGASALFMLVRRHAPPPQASSGQFSVVAQPSAGESISYSRENAIVKAANKVGPAVVSIGVTATRIVGVGPFGDPYFDSFFRDFIPRTRYYKYREAIPKIGSGVIVSPDGYVVTNAHVVHGAEEITVVTPDGRKLAGKLAGVHEASDIAIIRVDGKDLPNAELGDSDNLMVGEWAIAIGNPFGQLIDDTQPSVTVGVVSARKRAFKPDEAGRVYDDMIQTDAAINPGNSGGPLVNADGQIIGIDTFIFSKSGGSEGIGFAIPINRVKKILAEVKQHGKVRDVWLGFAVVTVDEETAGALKLPSGGAVVQSVELNSPADKAGLKAGDVVARVNGRVIKDGDDALSVFGRALVGDQFSIDVLRKDKQLKLQLIALEGK
ncbi:trypsin-like peptidase domain-containing protein [Candidatus Poribacteria bacterium]|nr:trypsin-like peptidase domain-containing protein [Candidatus Poribacteria bacterium]